VPVPYFLLFLCFIKVTHVIFLELDETKPKPPIFLGHETKSEGELEGARDQPHPGLPPWLLQEVVWAPWPPSDSASPSI
jgi:hypothetical protein